MRKALCVGIDAYEHIKDLHGCVNDANDVKAALERNGDGTLNFEPSVSLSDGGAYVYIINLRKASRL